MVELKRLWIRRAVMAVDAEFDRKQMCNRLECATAKCDETAGWVAGGFRNGQPVSRMMCAIHAWRYCMNIQAGVPAGLQGEYDAAMEEKREEEKMAREAPQAR